MRKFNFLTISALAVITALGTSNTGFAQDNNTNAEEDV